MKKTARRFSIISLVLVFLISFAAPTVAFADWTSDDIKSSDGYYTYRMLDNSNNIDIINYTGPGGDISIPSTIDGHSVTSIAMGAFDNTAGATSFTVPEGVTSMGFCVFVNNHDLVTVNLPSTLGFIGGGEVFYDCPKLTAINVSSLNTTFCSVGGVLYTKDMSLLYNVPNGYQGAFSIPASVTKINKSAFSKCEKLTSVSTIGSGIVEIGDQAFYECTSLTAINVDTANPNYSSQDGVLFNKDKSTLICAPGGLEGSFNVPSTVSNICSFAFCISNISVINLPASVLTIGDYVFSSSEKLTAINADAGNPNFASVDGVLFSKDLSKLIAYPAGKDRKGAASPGRTFAQTPGSFVIPDTVNEIAIAAFEGCSELTAITIPASVNKIGENAFRYCSDLTIYGNIGSYAQTYANENNMPFIAQDARPVGISYTKKDATVYGKANGSITITATGGNSGQFNYSINGGASWQDSSIFEGLSAGTYSAVVRDAAYTNNTASTTVTVDQPKYAGSYVINKLPGKAAAGTTITVKPHATPKKYARKSVTYSSSKSSVATADTNGNITFKKAGKVKITVVTVFTTTDKKGKTTSKTLKTVKQVTVVMPVSSITLNAQDKTIAKKSTFKLKAKVNPATATNKKLKWKSSNSKVASVNSAGVVTGKKKGTAVITCTALDGSKVFASCSVTVN